jgi:sigma-E factor negative regulatory protein RseA
MRERLSAMIDDELEAADCDRCLAQIGQDSELRETWDLYHLIGDALRGHAGPALPQTFAPRLAAEPTVLAPRRAERPAARSTWYALSAAASIAAVAFVGWMALPLFERPQEVAATAPAPAAPAMAVADVQPVPAAQGVNDYLLAHQRFSPSSAMGGIAPYVRTISEVREAR